LRGEKNDRKNKGVGDEGQGGAHSGGFTNKKRGRKKYLSRKRPLPGQLKEGVTGGKRKAPSGEKANLML